MAGAAELDLVILVPGRDEEKALRGVLTRYRSLKIRRVKPEFQRHPDHDPGCLLRGHLFLQREANRFRHALVMFDREGCGREGDTREELEGEVEGHLSASGWGDRAAAVVIDPELEAWVWADSPHVAAGLGWQGRRGELREWLASQGFFSARDQVKPLCPKEAVEQALRRAGRPRSSAIYGHLAEKAALSRCKDPAFGKLVRTLQSWFPKAVGSPR